MLLYSLLFATGYDLSMEDLREFRQWGSRTPGHPENTHTPGVEMATGPLGQGCATSVGMAIAEESLRASFARPGADVIDHYTYVLCSDGDLMEGVAQEAASLAGVLKLGRLIWLYDDNKITIDGHTDLAFTEQTEAKFQALGWHTQVVADGMDVDAVDHAIRHAKGVTDQPSLILCRTTIGYGSPNKAGSEKVHGSPLGHEELVLTKRALGLPDEDFYFPAEVEREMRQAIERGAREEAAWQDRFDAYSAQHPDAGNLLKKLIAGEVEGDWLGHVPEVPVSLATRNATGIALNAAAKEIPTLLSGAADLSDNVFTTIKGCGRFSPEDRQGRNVAYGIREHAMAAAANGITLHGAMKAVCGTFLIFSDYCKPSLRLAALMGCPTVFTFSHDSVGLGEDGPTHQPIEQLAMLRSIPNLNVMRPADANETIACWHYALQATGTPQVVITSRQALPMVTSGDFAQHPAKRGAYAIVDPEGTPDLILVATGSEVSLAIDAAKRLEGEGVSTRVVNLVSWFLFDQWPAADKDRLLPNSVPTLSIEAGSTMGWAKYADAHLGIDRFGASAPGPEVMRQFGFSVDHVCELARKLLRG